MPAAPQSERHNSSEQQQRQTLNAVIRKHVMHGLGEPADLLTVQVRRLWENWYRVNVLIGKDATSAKIANSYFLKADGDGNLVESTPKITKQY